MLNFKRQSSITDLFKLEFSNKSLPEETLKKHAVVVGVFEDEKSQKKLEKDYPFLSGSLAKAKSVLGFSGKFKELGFLTDGQGLLLVGLGSGKELTPKNFLSIGGQIAQSLHKLKRADVLILTDSVLPRSLTGKDFKDLTGRPLLSKPLTGEENLNRLITGFLMGAYRADFGNDSKKVELRKTESLNLILHGNTWTAKSWEKFKQQILEKAAAAYWVRDRALTPGNILIPETFAQEIKTLAHSCGVKCKIRDEAQIQKEGFGGIWAVGKGSEHAPRLVELEYPGTKKSPHIVLIGKGVTFDTGGISLKPHLGMEEMKEDMTGAAIVAAATAYFAKLKVPPQITALLPLVENSVGHKSVKPGDVHTAWGGQTVEVQNTDAEGRLILADCLAYAASLKPDLVIDLATLTGAASITMGPIAFLLYGNNAKQLDAFKNSTHSAGEECWEMPIFEEFFDDMKSTVANVKNIFGHRDANSSVTAAFLSNFVDNKYPWLHLDIASYATSTKWKGRALST